MTVISSLARAGLLVFQYNQLVAAAPYEHDRRDSWFCDGNGGTWNQDLWVSEEIGEYLTGECQIYSGLGASWPTDVSGVPRTIAEYGAGGDATKEDQAFNWGTECIDIEGVCDLSEGEIKIPACVGNENRAFALWAMRNAASFLQLYYRDLSDIFDTSALNVGAISTTFIGDGGSTATLGPLSWFIMAQGVIGAATAFIPVVGSVAGTASGIIGVAVGILAAVKDPALDPRFTTFADLQNRLSSVKQNTQTAISNYFNSLFRDSPAQGDRTAGTQLADLLNNGTWANQDMALLPYDKPSMTRIIQAGLISEAWNTQGVVIVSWAAGLLSNIGGTNIDPCFGSPFANDDVTNTILACENNRNYAAVRATDADGLIYSVAGWDTDTLNSWGLNHKVIIDNSESRQGAAGWLNRDVDVMINDLTAYAQNPPDNLLDALLPFNLPVCDLDAVDGLDWASKQCFGDPDICFIDVVGKNCPRLIINNVDFPYQSWNTGE